MLAAAAGWLRRETLARLVSERTAIPAAFLAAAASAVFILAVTLWADHGALRIAWRARTHELLGIRSGSPTRPALWLRRLPDPLEVMTRPLLRFPPVLRLVRDWRDAELGSKASRPFLLLVAVGSMGWLVGARIAGPLFGVALGLCLPLAPRAWIAGRAETARRRFGEQLPQVLDALASGLSAGLSLAQAVDYAAEELARPASAALRTLSLRLALGIPMERALASLLDAHPDDAFPLVVDGIALQRQFGGDLIRMLSETGARLRERIEVEQEVRAVTAQGRLSGWVLAALVPVSAALLLLSNPRYIDVLFDTWIGQSLLVLSLMLQLAGWAVISRLVRIAY
jgi:tight adherence protein B